MLKDKMKCIQLSKNINFDLAKQGVYSVRVSSSESETHATSPSQNDYSIVSFE